MLPQFTFQTPCVSNPCDERGQGDGEERRAMLETIWWLESKLWVRIVLYKSCINYVPDGVHHAELEAARREHRQVRAAAIVRNAALKG